MNTNLEVDVWLWRMTLTLIWNSIDKGRIWIHIWQKGAREISRANPLLLKWYVCFSSIWIPSSMRIPSMISPALISQEIPPISRYIVWHGITCIPSWMYPHIVTHFSAITILIICIWRMNICVGSSLIWRGRNHQARNILLIWWLILPSHMWDSSTIATASWCWRYLLRFNADYHLQSINT